MIISTMAKKVAVAKTIEKAIFLGKTSTSLPIDKDTTIPANPAYIFLRAK